MSKIYVLIVALSFGGCDLSDAPSGGGDDSCTSDSDCSAGFCGWLADNSRVCKGWAIAGDSCEGFVAPQDRAFCEPSLTCVANDPTFDLPGTCTAVASCTSDGDCNNGFCGFAGDTTSSPRICKPFQAEWGYCGGLVVQLSSWSKCAPGFQCFQHPSRPDDAPGTCNKDCSVDSDCTDSFCGFADDSGTRICREYRQEGTACGGFVSPVNVSQCEPGLYCYNDQPNMPDLQGECVRTCSTNNDCAPSDFCGTIATGATICMPIP